MNATATSARVNDARFRARIREDVGCCENPVDEASLEEMTRLFRTQRRRDGHRKATSAWLDGPLDDWLANLDDGETELGGDDMAAIAVGMHETLSIRDALILSMITDEEACPKAQLMEFAARPQLSRSKRRMCELLSAAFEDEGITPDVERCQTGVMMLLDIARAVPTDLAVQPLAVVAYALWWMGDEHAILFAMHCLAIDDECSLASIVFSAINRGIRPAWCAC
ncbi:hypothetical protein BEUL_1604 [Bifidobacterium eulemuris]|uniref:DUF4192 family protein n=2 Tax=Bifidobacterium eulemuris TaxID=1765219 RepID=A0A261G8I3_9BIFI|nr:hypothetical protein BEUL_1604 [Bifidobacterium eulemuris]QOL33059.1 DUF4192 family protein [Bifidobacterium eulemuris]